MCDLFGIVMKIPRCSVSTLQPSRLCHSAPLAPIEDLIPYKWHKQIDSSNVAFIRDHFQQDYDIFGALVSIRRWRTGWLAMDQNKPRCLS